jgi:site-specific DNA-cytosine methylase
MKIIDFFSGFGGASQAFDEDPSWEVQRFDNNLYFESVPHTRIIDIMCPTLTTWGNLFTGVDLMWFSPPCTEFSLARHPKIENPSMELVERSLEIVRECQPKYWVIENVRGAMKHFEPILGRPRQIIGPYHLWGAFPHLADVGDVGSKYDNDTWSTDPLRSNRRAIIPANISAALKKAVETQTQLTDFICI